MAGTLIPSTPTSSSLVIPEGQYQGAHAADITTRTNGAALQVGDIYFDSTLSKLKLYNGSVWVPSASLGIPFGAASLDSNGELIERPSGAAAEVAASRPASVKQASGTWFNPGTHDYMTLTLNYYATINVWSTVNLWSALQLSNFTYSNGVFICAKAGRYRVIFSPEAYNLTGTTMSALARLLSSRYGSRSIQYYTFTGSIGAYGGIGSSESIIDFLVGDTFSAQYYVTANAASGCYLQTASELIIEEL